MSTTATRQRSRSAFKSFFPSKLSTVRGSHPPVLFRKLAQAILETPPLSTKSSFSSIVEDGDHAQGVGNPPSAAGSAFSRKRKLSVRFRDVIPGRNSNEYEGEELGDMAEDEDKENRPQGYQDTSAGAPVAINLVDVTPSSSPDTGVQAPPTCLSEFLQRVTLRYDSGTQMTFLSIPATVLAVPISDAGGGPLDGVNLSMTFESFAKTSSTATIRGGSSADAGASQETAAILTALKIIPLVSNAAIAPPTMMRSTTSDRSSSIRFTSMDKGVKRRKIDQTENEWVRQTMLFLNMVMD
ncbi:hypothetical protein BGZ58_003844 [Dissophora ornata]|nr:hypothetical protein BGZ58_003844 [Dissophora ornata]